MGLISDIWHSIIGSGSNSGTSSGTSVTQAISTNRNVVVRNPDADWVASENFLLPKFRARTIVLAAEKMRPGSNIHAFINDENADEILNGCLRVEITPTQGTAFYGHSTPDYNDNWSERIVDDTTYDVIQKGDVITGLYGTAVVVADEIVYDETSLSNKRYLYVINLKGTLSGTITGSQSGTTATVIDVLSGVKSVNSLGNFYGFLKIPDDTYPSGKAKISISDSIDSNPISATTYADTSYESNGTLIQYTQHYTYGTRDEITITDITTKTAETYRYEGRE